MGGLWRASSASHSGKSSLPLSPTTPATGRSMRGAVYREVMHPCEKPMRTHRSGVSPYSSSSSPTYVSTMRPASRRPSERASGGSIGNQRRPKPAST